MQKNMETHIETVIRSLQRGCMGISRVKRANNAWS